MLETVFIFLFKYPQLVYEQGEFVWGASRFMALSVLAAAGVGAYAIVTYRGLRGRTTADRAVFITLRLATLGLLVFCLMRPMLVLKVAVPQQNFVGVLIDDSRSMLIADRDQAPRGQYVRDNFIDTFEQPAPMIAALSEKFVVRKFRFSQMAERLPAAEDVTFDGTGTRLGDALLRARDELAGLPLSGLVVVTDGADTSEATLDEPLAALKAESIPVFPIGVGADRMTRDIQVSRVEAPAKVLKGASLVVDVVITQSGYAGEKVSLVIENEGRIVSTQEITLPPDGEASTERVKFTADEAGSRVFRFRVPERPDEQVRQNNQRESLVQVLDQTEKILYLEGQPRAEAKFIRMAAGQDPNLQVVLLQRTAPDKYLRLGIDTPDELLAGFPATEEELFQYRSIVLGTVEASAFTVEQLRMISDFVSRRGGGLLALGGRRSFAEGGWTGTPVSEALPVDIESLRATPDYFTELRVTPARAGLTHPVLQIAETEAASAERWLEMPLLTTVNPMGRLKPGASLLLNGETPAGQDQVVLAAQRFGRGKAVAFAVQDSWLWRMHADIEVEDLTHHLYWQRLLRWLVDGVPSQVDVSFAPDRVEPKEPVKLSAWVVDKKFQDVSDARVVAHVRTPSGRQSEVAMDWTVRRDGEYEATFTPEEEGMHEVRVAATRGTEDLGSSVVQIRTASSDREYFDAAMRAPLLSRLAEETGGRFFRAGATDGLSEAITYSGRGVTVVEERDLWDLPAWLLLLIAFTGAEWAYRRARGLV